MKNFSDKMKSIFHSFLQAIFWLKKKKKADTSFKYITNNSVRKLKFWFPERFCLIARTLQWFSFILFNSNLYRVTRIFCDT